MLRATLKASEAGLARIRQARAERGWTIDNPRWLVEASRVLKPEDTWDEYQSFFADGISHSTWGRFLSGKQRIKPDAFKAYCQILGLPWEEIVDRHNNSPNSIDWGDAPDISYFCDRTEELLELEQRIVQQHCRLIALVGVGGIGKSALAVKLIQQIEKEFQYIIWRSLGSTLSLSDLITNLLASLPQLDSPHKNTELISQLIKSFHTSRCLLVLDRSELILQEGTLAGYYREGYEDYGELVRRIASERHQSCLVLIGREAPREIRFLEQESGSIRSLYLKGLPQAAAENILRANGLLEEPSWQNLIQLYRASPLSLKMISRVILELFGGSAAQFLRENTLVLGDIRPILDQQFQRLSKLERESMYQLAISDRPISRSQLRAALQVEASQSVSSSELIEALVSLKERSLIETSSEGEEYLFTLQPVINKYVRSMYHL
jgi:transcriptional regulator with XRE-family HTH domain